MKISRVFTAILLAILAINLIGCEKQIHEVRSHDQILTPAPHTAPRPA